ncbi:MAG: hypothetical protein ACI9S8_002346 [Chlamydiales bacterium]|jgi:hypothetical protein
MTVNLNIENILTEQTVEQVQQEFKDNPIPFKEWIGERNEEWMQSHLDLTQKVIKVIPEDELQSESIQRYFGVIRDAGLMKWQEPHVRELVLDQVGKGRIATAREVMSASGMPEPGVGGFQGLINLMQQLAPPSTGGDDEIGDKPADNGSGVSAAGSSPFPQGFPFPMPPNGGFGGMLPGLGGLPPGFEDMMNNMSEEEMLARLEAEMPGLVEFLENLPPPDQLLAMLEQKMPGITEMLGNMPPPGELMGSFPQGMPGISGMPGFPMPNFGTSSEALFSAVEEGDPLVLQGLINRGVNLDARDDDQRTAMHLAAESGNADLVQVLVDGNASVGLQDAEGSSPLHLACVAGHKDIAELLLANDANPMQRDNNGCTALHLLAFHGNADIVASLVENLREYYEANENRFLSAINAQDDDGDTPLSLAVENGHEDIAEILRDLLFNVV